MIRTSLFLLAILVILLQYMFGAFEGFPDRGARIIALTVSVMIIPTFIYFIINWEAYFDMDQKCGTCGTKAPYSKMHHILHGMGPESDCWTENICNDCSKTRKVGFLTQHVID